MKEREELDQASLSIDAYDFHLPEEQIAQEPAQTRDSSRLMMVPRDQHTSHHNFTDILELLPPKALLVLNDTKVVPARLQAHKESGGAIELLRVPDPENKKLDQARFMARGRLKRPGIKILIGENALELVSKDEDGTVLLKTVSGQSIDSILDNYGAIPLPPYIHRPEGPNEKDNQRYQTVFAAAPGAAAAPTAGLHFTDQLLNQLRDGGIDIAKITLHVGPGTFMPVRVDDIREHKVLAEPTEISDETAHMVNRARYDKRPIIAVGTTVVRTLEGAASRVAEGTDIEPGWRREDMVVIPGHSFRVVNGLITNFHLPKSSLLLLVSALVGRVRLLKAYEEAVREGYRFYSYGDAMYLPPSNWPNP